MNTYQSDNDVKLVIPYVAAGTQIYPDAVSYRVLDTSNVEVVATTVLSIEADDTQAEITIPAVSNALTNDETRAMRIVEVTVTTNNGVVIILDRYLIVSGDGLTVNDNTFMLYNEALMLAFDIPGLSSWNLSPEQERIAALIEAYNAINKLKFNVKGFSSEPFMLSEMTDDLWLEAPADFIKALKRAQVAEADVVLGSDWIEDKRRDGLMSETIGESSNMFRPGKPIVMQVRSRAMRYLAGYISLSKKVSRG